MDDYKQLIAGALARHVLTSLAGVLVTDGLVASGDQASFIKIGTGILVGAAGMGWSWWQKSGHAQVLAQLKSLKGGGK